MENQERRQRRLEEEEHRRPESVDPVGTCKIRPAEGMVQNPFLAGRSIRGSSGAPF
jgi:hypothetical protein